VKYTEYIKKTCCLKKVLISPGFILKPEDVPVVLEQHKQKYYRSFAAKLLLQPDGY
jgi:hypothetical protein